MLKNCLIAVLRMVLSDASCHPLNIWSLLLILDLVDGVQQPGHPGSTVLFLRHVQMLLESEFFTNLSCCWIISYYFTGCEKESLDSNFVGGCFYFNLLGNLFFV